MRPVRELLRWTKGLSYPARLAGAFAVVATATFLERLLWRWTVDHPYALFLTALVIASLVFQKTGFFALLLATFSILFFFTKPPFSLLMTMKEVDDLFIFLGTGLVIVTIGEVFRVQTDKLDDAEKRSAALLRELNHRTKNYFQMVGAAIQLEALKAKHPETRASLENVTERVMTVSRIAQALHQPGAEGLYDAGGLLEELTEGMAASLAGQRDIAIACKAEAVPLDRQTAEVLGIAANELITNAIKYAFPGRSGGTVNLEFVDVPGEGPRLTVADDGIGCPDTTGGGTGLSLVSSIVRMAGGRLEVQDNRPGCKVVVWLESRNAAAGPGTASGDSRLSA